MKLGFSYTKGYGNLVWSDPLIQEGVLGFIDFLAEKNIFVENYTPYEYNMVGVGSLIISKKTK